MNFRLCNSPPTLPHKNAGWVLANMIPFWYLLKVCGLFRVPANEETVGLDESYHGGTAYPGHGADDFLDKSASRHGKGDAMNGNGMSNTESKVPQPSHSLLSAFPAAGRPYFHVLRFSVVE